ncbi:MAG TPA: hypothetical protein VHG93_01360 [Longimicrobium sp.]|nr:hypothetical protein [Longimicrobium sp.]
MPETTSRNALRTADASFQTAATVCRELNYSIAYSQADPPLPPEQDLAARFSYALGAITTQGWGDFASDCAETVGDEPVDFSLYLIAGICEYIIGELKGVIDLGISLVGFAGEYYECAADIGRPLTIFDLDLILASDRCVPFHDSAMSIMSIREFLAEVNELSPEAVQELAREVLPVVMDVFVTVLEEGLELLGDQREAITAWMHETARDAAALGRMVGTIVGTILLELGTAGVARALKTARWVNRLPGTGLTQVAPDAMAAQPEARLGVRRILAAAGPVHQLDELADVFFKILRRNHKRFSRNLSMAKLRVLRKHVPAASLARFGKWRQRLSMGLAAGFHKHKGVVKPYSQSVVEVQNFNRRVLTFHYADAALDAEIDYFGLLARKDAILPNIFEANHIFEERLFHARKRAWSAELRKLGWNSPADMEAVLMSADEHTGSVRAMLRRYGLTEAEVDAVEPPKSITRTLLDNVRLREELNETPPAGVLVVEPDTPFIQVLSKYAELYRANSADLWERSLKAQFNTWRAALGLTEPVYS